MSASDSKAIEVPLEGIPKTVNERTFIALKPDAIQRGLIGNIVKRFEARGFKLVALKMLKPSLKQAQDHYADLKEKKFYGGLCEYFSSGSIVAMIWEGLNVVEIGRTLIGETVPGKSTPGSIRGDLCIDVGRNVVHGSDKTDSAAAEIKMWFDASEICNWNDSSAQWVYENPTTVTHVHSAYTPIVGEQVGDVPQEGKPGTAQERSFIAIKPDGVQRKLVGNILARFENRGFQLVGLKMIWPSLETAQSHYIDLKSKGFYDGLCKYFSSGPIVAMVWQGKDMAATGRVILGETNPKASTPGSIRGDLCIDVGRNVCHGSDSTDSAAKEIQIWFPKEQLVSWTSAQSGWVYE